jgi:helix-turn-helix protein
MKKANSRTNESQPIPKTNNTASNQRKAIYQHLIQEGHLTTLYAREQLGIMSPAARIFELRRNGHMIDTYWTTTVDITGTKHREAAYILWLGGDSNV